MTFMTDRAVRGEARRDLFQGLLGRIPAWFRHSPKRGSGVTAVELDETPARLLRDIGLLDGRPVIPRHPEDGWR